MRCEGIDRSKPFVSGRICIHSRSVQVQAASRSPICDDVEVAWAPGLLHRADGRKAWSGRSVQRAEKNKARQSCDLIYFSFFLSPAFATLQLGPSFHRGPPLPTHLPTCCFPSFPRPDGPLHASLYTIRQHMHLFEFISTAAHVTFSCPRSHSPLHAPPRCRAARRSRMMKSSVKPRAKSCPTRMSMQARLRPNEPQRLPCRVGDNERGDTFCVHAIRTRDANRAVAPTK